MDDLTKYLLNSKKCTEKELIRLYVEEVISFEEYCKRSKERIEDDSK